MLVIALFEIDTEIICRQEDAMVSLESGIERAATVTPHIYAAARSSELGSARRHPAGKAVVASPLADLDPCGYGTR